VLRMHKCQPVCAKLQAKGHNPCDSVRRPGLASDPPRQPEHRALRGIASMQLLELIEHDDVVLWAKLG